MQRSLTLGMAIAALVCSCGGPYDTSGDGSTATASTTTPSTTGPGATAPQVDVVTPGNNAAIEFEDEDDRHHGDDNFDVEVHVDRASLAEPGNCSGSGSCGHLVLLIDGAACGNPNSSASKKKFKGNFGRCRTVSGTHQIVVQLVDDRGNVLAQSPPVTVEVRFKGDGD